MKITVRHGDYPRYRYRLQHKDYWRRIETALAPDGLDYGRRLELHRTIRKHITVYRANHLLWKTSPLEKQAWDKLQKVVDTAGKLNRILEGLGPLRLQLEKQFTPLRPIENMCMEVAEIEAAAGRAMSRLPHVPAKDADGKLILTRHILQAQAEHTDKQKEILTRRLRNGELPYDFLINYNRKEGILDEPVMVPDRRGGRPPDVPLLHLVARLGGVFEATTGRPASERWRNPYTGKYHDSRFVGFLRAALSLAGRAQLKRYGAYALDDLIDSSKPYKPSY